MTTDSSVTHSVNETTPRPGIGVAAYIFAGLSFIPLLGVVFGLISLVWAAVSRRAGWLIVAIVSVCGIGFTIGIYSWLFYQMRNLDGLLGPLNVKLAQTMLFENVKAIELYKLQTGSYPETLAELQKHLPDNGIVSVADPSALYRETGRDFYYVRISESAYDLRGVGVDGKPFTADDLLPDLGSGPRGQIGLVTPSGSQTDF